MRRAQTHSLGFAGVRLFSRGERVIVRIVLGVALMAVHFLLSPFLRVSISAPNRAIPSLCLSREGHQSFKSRKIETMLIVDVIYAVASVTSNPRSPLWLRQ